MADTHFEEVRELLSEELAVFPDKIQRDTDLKTLGADSIVFMGIVDSIQEKYDIDVSAEDIKAVRTVGDIVDYLDRILA